MNQACRKSGQSHGNRCTANIHRPKLYGVGFYHTPSLYVPGPHSIHCAGSSMKDPLLHTQRKAAGVEYAFAWQFSHLPSSSYVPGRQATHASPGYSSNPSRHIHCSLSVLPASDVEFAGQAVQFVFPLSLLNVFSAHKLHYPSFCTPSPENPGKHSQTACPITRSLDGGHCRHTR